MNKRTFIYIALTIVAFFLWQTWQKDYPEVSHQAEMETTRSSSNADLPPVSAQNQAKATAASPATSNAEVSVTPTNLSVDHSFILVETDVVHVKIDREGGNITQLSLPKYPVSSKSPDKPTLLLESDPASLYISQSGLIGDAGPDTQEGQATYTSSQKKYSLAPDQNQLDVKLSWNDKNGLKVTKVFTFYRGKYDIKVRYDIKNDSSKHWSGQFYAQLRQKPKETSSGFFGLHTYQGAAISSPKKPYEKISFSKMDKTNLDQSVQGGWLTFQEQYFLTAWIPDQSQTNRYYTRADVANHLYTLGYVSPPVNVSPGSSAQVGGTLYAGPEIPANLKTLAPHMDLTVDYGWFWPISASIFWVMKHIYDWVGNWGWSIILVTFLIKLLFYKLSETSYRSMAKMRKLTPKMQAIKERYGDDKQKMSQLIMELYRKEKVSPLSGCLPILVQIPFFIALYYVLIESVELRQAPFIFWITDLSTRDPYYVLPILMGISMFVQQKLNPPPPDPIQAKVMMLLPAVFTVFFVTFPAGLVLYWLANNCLSILQQWYITKRVENA